MPDVLRIRRRLVGGAGAGAPAGLFNAEIAYNENDDILWYGKGLGGGNLAVAPIAVGGVGMASGAVPSMNTGLTGVAGTAGNWARGDHVHPSDTSRAPTASPTLTGTTTINGTVTGTAITALHGAPGPIGNTTPSTGAFTTLSASGAVSGAGFTAYLGAPPAIGGTTPNAGTFTNLTVNGTLTGAALTGIFAAPPPIGNTTPSTGAFTTLSASGAVSGAGFTTLLAAPPAIGVTTPSSGAFTTLSATSTVSGAGFSAYLGAPPAIGGTTPNAGTFTNLTVNGALTGAALTGIFAAPPAIGSTTPGTGAFTTLSASGAVSGAGFNTLLAPYAKIDSQTFTGSPILPVTTTLASSPAAGTNNTVVATTAFVRAVRLDQFATPTADVPWGGRKITGLADPVASGDAATRNYVDLAIQGINAKQAVRVATVANLVALSGLLTIDGITLLVNDRVLVKDQTAAAQNGVYVASSTAWSRAQDFNIWSEFLSAFVFVEEGTANANNGYLCTAIQGGTIDTTPNTWVQFSGAGQINAGTGLTKTGNTIDAKGTTGRIVVGADNIDIDSTYVGQNSITTLGTIATGTWSASTILLNRGGTGATTIAAGYVTSDGTTLSSVVSFPPSAVTGLGTMATQNANAVAITGGTFGGGPGITWDLGTF
jgi:hypothetical protein